MTDNMVQSPGCVILLIDESAAMESPLQEASGAGGGTPGQMPKSRADSVATAVNALLKRLGNGPDFDVAVVGYRTQDDEAVVEPRWGGPLAGRRFVATKELADAPVTVEQRTRKMPNPAGFGPPVEQPIEFPVWYQPQTGGKAPQVAAFQFCREMLEEWTHSAGPNPGVPLVIHVFAGGTGDGNPHQAVQDIMGVELPTGSPLVLHAHLSTSQTVPATLFPSNRYYLPVGPQKDLFSRCSPLPGPLLAAMKAAGFTIQENAVGMMYNARMLDIVKLLKLIDTHTEDWPERAASSVPIETPEEPEFEGETIPLAGETDPPLPDVEAAEEDATETLALDEIELLDDEFDAGSEGTDAPFEEATFEVERTALVVLLLDRSLDDPYSGNTASAFARLQDHANDLLGRMAKKSNGQLTVAVVSYGTDVAGDSEVRTSWEGNLAGQVLVSDAELADGALRVEEFEKQVPNGIGGLMTIPVKQSIFVELEPTSATTIGDAFASVGGILQEWSGQHPHSCLPPIVIHLTRGSFEAGEVATQLPNLQSVEPNAGSVLLYHLVATEEPHPSVVFPASDENLQTPALQELFEHTGLLIDSERLASEKPQVVEATSRGMVVNGKIDLVLDAIYSTLDPQS